MAIVARTLEGITCVAVTAAPPLGMPDPSKVLALFPKEAQTGARYLDDAALGVRVFTFPNIDLRLIFEPSRVRVEATKPKKPDELPLAEFLSMLVETCYPKMPFPRYGYNYDFSYQYDAVIPQGHIIGAFLDKETSEKTTHFGWQFTLSKEKGKRKETYFMKVTSPLELRAMANIEFEQALPKGKESQSAFVRCYTEAQGIAEHVNFS